MPSPPDEKREAILAAAQIQFSRYGFRRTSMEDIAKETGVSRASLYSYFENKEEIFRSLAGLLHERSLAGAEGELKHEIRPLEDRIHSALAAKFAPFLEVLAESAHGSELNDESNRLCGELVLASSERFVAILATALSAAARAGEIDLKSAGLSARSAAELIHLGTGGLKHGAPDAAELDKRLEGFVRVFVAGLRA